MSFVKEGVGGKLHRLQTRIIDPLTGFLDRHGIPAGSPLAPINLLKFLAVAAQVALLVRVIGGFRIESVAFLNVINLALAGFVVHHFTPRSYRLPLFVALSMGGIWIVFGLGSGLWLVGIGLALIAICHLPGPWWTRLAVLLAVAAMLALHRGDWLAGPVPTAVWPILGSMFMFRLIVYMYDLRHDPGPLSLSRTLAYFFMLPNVCFPLFPVVDYKTFRRTYYDDDPFRIYQRGVDWMVRGVIHLLLYRIVYYHLTIAPSEVSGPATLAQWMLSGFLLYLRVSGQFHLIVGMLHLFGFHLPETHRGYWLASSFTDFWRRINIYWKDFMLKILFYPVHFKLRRWGATTALVVSTLLVFAATWALHAYQWFWLRGSVLLTWPDALFWAILGSLGVVNALYESAHGRARSLGARRPGLRPLAGRVLATAGTFATICLLWSLWNSESIEEWVAVWAVGLRDSTTALLLGSAMVAVATMAVGGGAAGATPSAAPVRGPRPPPRHFVRPAVATGVTILFLYVVGTPVVYSHLGATMAQIMDSVRERQLNQRDAALLHRGYYQNLMSVDRFNSQLWEVYTKRPLDWVPFRDTEAVRPTGDFRSVELLPGVSIMHRGALLNTNRWGMRDRDYEKIPAPETYRIALLGSSHTMGLGVAAGEAFEELVEDRLNRENTGSRHARYELLNFAVASHTAPQHLMTLEQKVLPFSPHMVLYVGHSHDASNAVTHLAAMLARRAEIPYEFLWTSARRAGVEHGVAPMLAEQRLRPLQSDVLAAVYRRIVEVCRERGIVPVWLFVPLVAEDPSRPEVDDLHQMARAAGFVTLSVRDAYQPFRREQIRLAEWDEHPNARGHQALAEALYLELLASSEHLRIGLRHTPAAP